MRTVYKNIIFGDKRVKVNWIIVIEGDIESQYDYLLKECKIINNACFDSRSKYQDDYRKKLNEARIYFNKREGKLTDRVLGIEK